MRPKRTWHRTSLLIALSMVTASAAVFAASGRPDKPAQSYSFLFSPGNQTWLGIAVTDVNQAKATELKLPGVYGAIVVSVMPGSPAAKAGIEKNDVILEFAGQRVRSVLQLRRLVKETPPDRAVSIKISRRGKLQTLQAKIENRGPSATLKLPGLKAWQRLSPHIYGPKGGIKPMPQKPFLEPMPKFYLGPLPNPKSPPVEPQPKGKIMPMPWARPFIIPFSTQDNPLGISGRDLTSQWARFYGVSEGHGVLIRRVTPGGPASVAGLKAGDVIVSVGSQQIWSMAELRRALQFRQNTLHWVTLRIVRSHEEREMTVFLAPSGPSVKPEPIMAMRLKC